MIRIKYKRRDSSKNVLNLIRVATMTGIAKTLSDHHKLCDALFARCERAALERRWVDTEEFCARICRAMNAHRDAEESVSFAGFESATGIMGGRTRGMRAEYAQMRDLLQRLAQSTGGRRHADDADGAEMLLIRMQRHNLKQEDIVYPLCARALAPRSDELTRQLVQALTPP
ncbi:MAG TPA: hemerythrin domain-containing protein [Burkholderiaceae bacterium]|nr:hemerythrin domain-containing protein [Burkholderiaceae bacterium]